MMRRFHNMVSKDFKGNLDLKDLLMHKIHDPTCSSVVLTSLWIYWLILLSTILRTNIIKHVTPYNSLCKKTFKCKDNNILIPIDIKVIQKIKYIYIYLYVYSNFSQHHLTLGHIAGVQRALG